MKKTLILSVICFLGIGLFAQNTSPNEDNEALKKQLWIIKQEFKEMNMKHVAKLDSLLEVLSYTQYVVNKQSDSLETTGEKLSFLEEDTETQKESVSEYINNNRINMGVIFLIIIAFNIIIFIILRNRLNANYSHTENKFNEAFIDFDDDIKAASTMLNKYIKEVKESLDNQIKTTNTAIDTKIKSISESTDKKISDTKALFDEYALKSKEEFAKEIKTSKDNFKKNIKKTENNFDLKLENIMASFDDNFKERCKTLDDKIMKLTDKK